VPEFAKILHGYAEFSSNVKALSLDCLVHNAVTDGRQELRWCQDTAMLGTTMFTLAAI